MKDTSRTIDISNTVSDLVSNFLYYDRKEDESLPRGEIEAAIAAGEISVEELCALFRAELEKGLA